MMGCRGARLHVRIASRSKKKTWSKERRVGCRGKGKARNQKKKKSERENNDEHHKQGGTKTERIGEGRVNRRPKNRQKKGNQQARKKNSI